MAMVDVTAIENSMKMASLDTLNGYAKDHFAVVMQGTPTEYVKEKHAKGYQVLSEPAWNLGMLLRC